MKTTPRLARCLTPPLFRSRREHCLTDWGIRFIVQHCEFLNEGQTVMENGKTVYYGSALITLRAQDSEGTVSKKRLDDIVTHIRWNPLLNVRLARIARLEAMRRIGLCAAFPAALTCSVKRAGDAIEITIDVELPEIQQANRVEGR